MVESVLEDFSTMPTLTLVEMRDQLEAKDQALRKKSDEVAILTMMGVHWSDVIIDAIGRTSFWIGRQLGVTHDVYRHSLYGPLNASVAMARLTLLKLLTIEKILRVRGEIR